MIPTYGGFAIFGIVPKIRMVPNANAMQVAEFFGLDGYQSLMGGTRGRIFEVEGILTSTLPGFIVSGPEAVLLSYATGQVATLVDTVGVAWPNVIFKGEYMRTPIGDNQFLWFPSLGVWGMPYRAVFQGLT